MAIVNLQGRSLNELRTLFMAANNIKNTSFVLLDVIETSDLLFYSGSPAGINSHVSTRINSNADGAETQVRLKQAGAKVETKPYRRDGNTAHELAAFFE